ncbi:hypothetical protein JB92DRAFT_2833016 [Gautieria morchelliformis]|nr:hypothetical protein JB92DRAFT_2833016 [Gautieria morchelliformis]
MASNQSSSLSVLIEQMQIKLKVRPDLRGALREEVEEWVAEAEELQAKLRTTLRVEAIVDPEVERLLDVDDLVREVKGAKEWLGSLGFIVSPEFLDVEMNAVPGPTMLLGPLKEPEVVGGAAKEPGAEGDSMREPETLSKIPLPIAGSPGQLATVQPRSSGSSRRLAIVARARRMRRLLSRTKFHNQWRSMVIPSMRTYSGGTFIAGVGDAFTMVMPAAARRERCVGDAFAIARVVSRQRYVAKDKKDGREPEVKERGSKGKSKGKAKDKGSTTGPSSISWKGVLGKLVVYLRRHLNVYAGRRGEGGGAGGEVGGADEECVPEVERFKRRGFGSFVLKPSMVP